MSDLAAWSRAIGQTVRRLRTSQGLTQAELAGAEFSKSYISQLERGTVVPSLRALDVLAGRLGVPTTFFLDAAFQEASFLLKAASTAYFCGDLERAAALARRLEAHAGDLRLRERIEHQLLRVRLEGSSGRWSGVHQACGDLEALLSHSAHHPADVTIPLNYWWGKAWLAGGNRRQAVRRWELGFQCLRDRLAPPPAEGLTLMAELAELYRHLGDRQASEHVRLRARETVQRLCDVRALAEGFLALPGPEPGRDDLLHPLDMNAMARDAEAWARAHWLLRTAELLRGQIERSPLDSGNSQ